jgi:hypothetical protein
MKLVAGSKRETNVVDPQLLEYYVLAMVEPPTGTDLKRY